MTQGKRPYVGNHPHGGAGSSAGRVAHQEGFKRGHYGHPAKDFQLTPLCQQLGVFTKWIEPWDFQWEKDEELDEVTQEQKRAFIRKYRQRI